MANDRASYDELKRRLSEAESSLESLRSGQVDAIVGPSHITILQLKEVQQALRESNQRLRTALDASGGAIYQHRVPLDESTHHDVRWAEMLGYRHDELPPYDRFLDWLFERVHPDDRHLLERTYRDFVEGRSPDYHIQIRLRHNQGHWIWVEAFSRPIQRDENGRVREVVGVMTDITKRKHLEHRLRESEARFRAMADEIPLMIWVTNTSGELEFVNRAYCEFFGTTTDEIQSANWRPWVHVEDRAEYVDEFQSCLKERRPFHAQVRVRRHDGEWRWVESFGRLRFSHSGEFLGMAGGSPDITDRKRVEDALRRSEKGFRELNETLERRVAERTTEAEERAARLRALASELERVEDRERRKLAEDLHDDLGQVLTAIHTKLSLLRNAMPEIGPSELATELEEMDGLVQRADATTRSITFQLSPPILHDLGLLAAIRWLGEDMRRLYNLNVHLEHDEGHRTYHERLKLVLFRSIRELLLNAAKHARTGDVRLSIKHPESFVETVVEDRGVGFDVTDVSRSHQGLGLFSLRERIESMGGAVEIHSRPKEGTRVTLKVPIEA
jgi:PAS domain S-box-containing protein